MKNRLRQLREEKGWTQLKVALDLNLNQNSVSRYENGSRDLSSDALVMFADYYRVSIDYLLFRTDCPELNGASQNPSATESKK